MEEGSGTSILDASGNGLTGGTFNGPTWVTGHRGHAFARPSTARPSMRTCPTTPCSTSRATSPWPVGSSRPFGHPGHPREVDEWRDERLRTDACRPGSAAAPGKAFVRFNQAASADTYRLNSSTYYPSDGNTWMHARDDLRRRDHEDLRQRSAGRARWPCRSRSRRTRTPMGIASQHDGSGARFLQGAIDDIRVYNRALSASEIAALVGHRRTRSPHRPARTARSRRAARCS